eukprot:901649-Pyramimonas_sp.AAC.1
MRVSARFCLKRRRVVQLSAERRMREYMMRHGRCFVMPGSERARYQRMHDSKFVARPLRPGDRRS